MLWNGGGVGMRSSKLRAHHEHRLLGDRAEAAGQRWPGRAGQQVAQRRRIHDRARQQVRRRPPGPCRAPRSASRPASRRWPGRPPAAAPAGSPRPVRPGRRRRRRRRRRSARPRPPPALRRTRRPGRAADSRSGVAPAWPPMLPAPRDGGAAQARRRSWGRLRHRSAQAGQKRALVAADARLAVGRERRPAALADGSHLQRHAARYPAAPCRPSTCDPTPSPARPPPCAAAMAEAEVGDDVWGDDPTVHRAGARGGGAAGQGGGRLRALRHDGQPDRDPRPHPPRRRDPGARAGARGGPRDRRHGRALGRADAHARRRPAGCSSPTRSPAGCATRPTSHHARQSLVCLENTVGERAAWSTRWSGSTRSARSRTSAACACTWTAPGCGTRPSPPAPIRPAIVRDRRLGLGLLLEGAGRAGRLGRGRRRRLDRAAPAQPQAVRRRHAPGRHHRRRRAARAATPRRAARRRPPKRAARWPRGWPAGRRMRDRPRAGRDQHRVRPRSRDGTPAAAAGRGDGRGGRAVRVDMDNARRSVS